uniref:Uncharacterized protein n=1 Tax=Eutreptiella gymnastica TaxID=73025 RepID=A0A7S4LGM0_9EUGL
MRVDLGQPPSRVCGCRQGISMGELRVTLQALMAGSLAERLVMALGSADVCKGMVECRHQRSPRKICCAAACCRRWGYPNFHNLPQKRQNPEANTKGMGTIWLFLVVTQNMALQDGTL